MFSTNKLVMVLIASAAAACGSSKDTATAASGGATVASSGTAGVGGSGSGGSGSGGSASGGSGGANAAPSFVAKTDPMKGELAEGLFVRGTTAYVGYAPLGKIVKVALPDGAVSDFATIPGVPAMNGGYTLGIALDAAGNVYAGQSAAMSGPAPGIYKFPAAGGSQSAPWAKDAAMNFPNGLAFDAKGALFVADSGGTIFKIDTAGVASKWLADPSLAGTDLTCKFAAPFPIGANGIAFSATGDAAYVANTNLGQVVRIPIDAQGAAGKPTIFAGPDCNALGAIDGIAIDAQGRMLAVVNAQNKLIEFDKSGKPTTVVSGAPLDNPGSVFIATVAGKTAAYVTNTSFFSTKKTPGLVAAPLP